MATRDVGSVVALLATMYFCRLRFVFRGVTYRSTVVPLGQERAAKGLLYLTFVGLLDALARRLAGLSLATRACLLWAPATGWAVQGPLSYSRTSRSDAGFNPRAQKWSIFRWMAKHLFKKTRMLLSEEWRTLTKEQVQCWQKTGPFLIGMHPHGILPMGGIINGLTWFGGGPDGGGLENLTTSGSRDVPAPEVPGELLHQRFFPDMQLRCAVASGVFFPPLFYEGYTALGAIECTKPFMRDALRDGRTVAVYPGGATESRFARPGRYACYLKCRRGFLRLALEERVHVFPIYTFGDEGIVPQPKELPKWLYKVQKLMKEVTGLLVPPVPIGLLRFPPLTSVVGVPVHLEDLWADVKGGEVSQAAVDEAHERYLVCLQKLFDANKAHVPGGHAKAVLEIL